MFVNSNMIDLLDKEKFMRFFSMRNQRSKKKNKFLLKLNSQKKIWRF